MSLREEREEKERKQKEEAAIGFAIFLAICSLVFVVYQSIVAKFPRVAIIATLLALGAIAAFAPGDWFYIACFFCLGAAIVSVIEGFNQKEQRKLFFCLSVIYLFLGLPLVNFFIPNPVTQCVDNAANAIFAKKPMNGCEAPIERGIASENK